MNNTNANTNAPRYSARWLATDGSYYETAPQSTLVATREQFLLVTTLFTVPGPADGTMVDYLEGGKVMPW